MIDSDGWNILGIASIGAIAGAFGGWVGELSGKTAFGPAVGNIWVQKAAIGAVSNSVASGVNTAGLQEFGYLPSSKDDVLSSILWGGALGAFGGWAQGTFYPNFAAPSVVVSEGAGYSRNTSLSDANKLGIKVAHHPSIALIISAFPCLPPWLVERIRNPPSAG